METSGTKGWRMTKASHKQALIFGLGFSGHAIAERLREAGWKVIGTTRSGGAEALRFDGTASLRLKTVAEDAALVISCVPPARDGSDPVLDAFPEGFPRARAVVYLSATSVYGDRNGQWAFEGEPPTPSLRRGLARAEAELLWLETGGPVHVLRCAGIYGPGRSVLDKLDRAVVREGHVINRIHIDDLAELVARIAQTPVPGIYNVADGHPEAPEAVVDFAARLAGQPTPPRVGWRDPSLSEMARSFYSETKRVDIGRAKRTFSWEPRYPSYREGLRQVLEAERNVV